MQWQGDNEAFDALSKKLDESMELMNFANILEINKEMHVSFVALSGQVLELKQLLVEALAKDPQRLPDSLDTLKRARMRATPLACCCSCDDRCTCSMRLAGHC